MLRRLPSKLTAESFVIISCRVALTSCLSPTAGLGEGCMCILPGVTRTRSDGPAPGDPHPCLVQGPDPNLAYFLAKSGLAWCIRAHCRSSNMPATLACLRLRRHASPCSCCQRRLIRRKQSGMIGLGPSPRPGKSHHSKVLAK